MELVVRKPFGRLADIAQAVPVPGPIGRGDIGERILADAPVPGERVTGLRGEESIAALCRREGIAEGLYYSWSKEFLEAGKKRLAGDTGRQATSGEVKGLRQEMRDLKELVAELSLENRLLKKSMIADGGDEE